MADLVFSSYKGRSLGLLTPIDLDTDDIKIMLTTATYTPSAAHDFRDDITNEVSASGTYVAGGSSLTSKAINASGANYAFDSADPAWTGATITARYAVLYKNVGTAATDPVIGVWDLGGNITSTAGTFTVAVNASGWLLQS